MQHMIANAVWTQLAAITQVPLAAPLAMEAFVAPDGGPPGRGLSSLTLWE
ncbi:UNVERIFIED_CONTAM: hypothetical protein Sradi_1503600 [Sesamum radiatum]|uniref:Uncharacterized protein n=1 Tax=Sesamum radiatum TaxID=300843 RepID=A0AAW2U764_SESRA